MNNELYYLSEQFCNLHNFIITDINDTNSEMLEIWLEDGNRLLICFSNDDNDEISVSVIDTNDNEISVALFS